MFSKKKYCFAQAAIDTKSGDVTRNMLMSNIKELGGYILPRQMRRGTDTSKGIVVMVQGFMKSKKKYGSVSL
jgi:hypothetical protein